VSTLLISLQVWVKFVVGEPRIMAHERREILRSEGITFLGGAD